MNKKRVLIFLSLAIIGRISASIIDSIATKEALHSSDPDIGLGMLYFATMAIFYVGAIGTLFYLIVAISKPR